MADWDNRRIRKITTNSTGLFEVSTLVGTGTQGSTDGTGNVAQFYFPSGVAVDSAGVVYVADNENHRIHKITPGGVVSTLAGTGTQGSMDDTNGMNGSAQFNYPSGVAVDSAGVVYVADSQNHRIRKITPGGVVSTLAGTGTQGFMDGVGNVAQFYSPTGVAVDSVGNVYVTDRLNHRIRKITILQ